MSDMQQQQTHDGEMSSQIKITMLPMSLRSFDAEMAYQQAKASKQTVPLELEPSLKIWDHWRLISNRFPYDVAFGIHHMLLPKRAGIVHRWDLNDAEKSELEKIIKEFVYDEYDLWFENCPKRRSVAHQYHLHLATYLLNREDMKL